jgi:hypothetical protein
MLVRREEVPASDDVLAELGWVNDGDGLADRTRLEFGGAALYRQPRIDVTERRTEGRDSQVLYRKLDGRVGCVEGVGAVERLNRCRLCSLLLFG